MGWTKDQEKVIDKRNKDILVSAAAGSGKTAVLVERIINRVLSDDNPVDIDRILVLTFTKEAAREMRDRIRKAIEKKAAENPGDKRVEKQKTLVHYAKISTIDSFCTNIVRNSFQEIDVDPDFRVMDEAESVLMKQEAMKTVMREGYESGSEAFYGFIRSYKKKSSDSDIRELIDDFYKKSQSFAWPGKWMDEIKSLYDVHDFSQLEELPWMKKYMSYLRGLLRDYENRINKTAESIEKKYHCPEFAAFIREDAAVIHDVLGEQTGKGLIKALCNINFPRLSKKDADDEVKEMYQKQLRPIWQKNLKDYKKNCPEDLDMIVRELQEEKPYVDELVKLTKAYGEEYDRMKEEANVLDFSDIEHDALKILMDEETGQATEVALEFRDFFEEVMVDEYQDSNEVQEYILQAVSKIKEGSHDYFCVGDVKQSIYAFRQADPGIFMKKFKDFAEEDNNHVRIDLNKNFRSRQEVLDIANDTFMNLMTEDMGDVEYTEEVSLKYGAEYLSSEKSSYDAEIYYANPSREDLQAAECESSEEYEYRIVAEKIRSLLDSGFEVQDRDKDGNLFLRPVRLSDIAILSRGVSDSGGSMTRLLDTLRNYGIDAVLADRSGFFAALEVETILAFLEILDNPHKDIELAAVLKSVAAGLDNDDLLEIRRYSPSENFYNACRQYLNASAFEKTREKLARFFSLYDDIRARRNDMSLPDLIREIYDRTGFLNYAASLPGGTSRKANLLKLIDVAENLEQNSTHDLFSFMDYIRKRKRYNQEISMAALKGEEDDVVRIMTIHKSKGLEFPVVFLINAGKGFNDKDFQGNACFTSKYGAAFKRPVGGKYRMLVPTFYLKALQTLQKLEQRGEEERILYVAMTRAKEKLIITGRLDMKKDDESELSKYEAAAESGLMLSEKMNATSYLDWILPSVMNIKNKEGNRKYKIEKASLEKMIASESSISDTEEKKKKELNALLNSYDKNLMGKLQENLAFKYNYGPAAEYKSKYSVSEVKHMEIELNRAVLNDTAGEAEAEDTERLFGTETFPEEIERLFGTETFPEEIERRFAVEPCPEEDDEERITESEKKVSGESQNPGALFGTAMHRALEGLDFRLDYDSGILDAELDKLSESGFLSEDESRKINRKMLLDFLNGPARKLLSDAAKENKLLKEQNFVFSEKIKKVFSGIREVPEGLEDEVLIQGTIDVLIVDDDGVTVLDYKTDRVRSAEELVLRYSRQLQLYGDAAGRAVNRPVKKLYLYSFKLNELIEIDCI